MASMIGKLIQLLAIPTLISGYDLQSFRFDYKLDKEAGVWLKYHRVPATWAEARMQCYAEGAILASPLTNKLRAAIVSLVKNETDCGAMIFTGVHATYSKGVYTSIEGVPLLRLAITWATGEPDNYENNESCLAMKVRKEGFMFDVKCKGVLPYVCYKKDAIMIVTECGTEYVKNNETGSCYKFHSKILPWAEAYKTCEAEGAYLAIINSVVEAEVVRTLLEKQQRSNNFKSRYPNNHYIGFHDWGQTHNFMTIHGQSLDQAGYQKWNGFQPNNISFLETNDVGQMCGAINTNGRLHSVYCNLPHSFLCEMTPHSLH